MNLKSKKARVPLAGCTLAALASGGLMATSASAVGETLTFSPAAASATISTLSGTNRALSYGFRAAGTAAVGAVGAPVRVAVLTGPAALDVAIEDANAVPGTFGAVAVGSSSTDAEGETYTAASRIYVAAGTAGTYTLRAYKDSNDNGIYEPALDDSTPVMTVNAKAPDDSLALAAPGSVDAGTTAVRAAITTDLTTSDIRGGAAGSEVLGTAIAAALNVDIVDNGAGGTGVEGHNGANTPVNYAGGTFFTFLSSGVGGVDPLTQGATTPHTLTSQLQVTTGSVNVGTADTTTVTTNGVTAVAITPEPGQEKNVALTGPATYSVRAGFDQVKFMIAATIPVGTKAGKTVNVTFTETPITALQVNGKALVPNTPGGNTSTVPMTTDADGMVAFTVDSSLTANGEGYTVAAASGTVSDTVAVNYAGPAVTTLTTSGNLAATIGGSVTLGGQVLDQWGQGYVPSGSPQATLQIDKSAGSFVTADESHSVDITANGNFTYTYADTGNTTARTDAYRWTVGGQNSPSSQIRWVTNVVPAKATITGLGSTTAFPVPAAADFAVSDHDTVNATTITGTVQQADNSVLPFGEFSLSGTEGVYFLNAAGKAVTSLAARANEAGQISANGSTNGVQVFFTKAGEDTEITLTVGTTAAAKTGTFTVNQPTEAWKVTLNELTVAPGENGTISGRVEDAFGNAVPGVTVDLSLEGADFGVISSSPFPQTNSQGRFSALFVSGSTDSGTVQVVAEINGGTPATVAAGTVTTTGVAYQAGVNRAEQDITVKPVNPVTIVSPASRVGPGAVEISGVGNPGAPVDIYVKRTGTTDDFRLLQTVAVDAEGEWGAEFPIVRSATIYARQGTVQSAQKTITVFSSVTISATALGNGRVQLRADGNPNQATNLSFYTFDGGVLRKIVTKTTSASGYAEHVATLSKGAHVFRAYYVATGTRSAFAQKTITVK